MRDAWQETALGLAVAFAGAVAALALEVVQDTGAAFFLTILLLLAYAAGLLAMRRATARYHADVTAMVRVSSDMPRRPHRMRLDHDGIATEKRDPGAVASTGHWSWAEITEAEESGGLLLFWIGHVHGFCLPARAFGTPDEARAALAFARARIAATR